MKIPDLDCSSFYVYLHKRATDGSVFYVGKGSGRRAWSNKRSEHWRRIVNKSGLVVEIVQFGMREWWAFEFERDLIFYYGRDTLCNATDGGEGLSGYKFTDDHKLKIGNYHKGKKKLPHVIEALRQANIGRKLPKEHREKLSKIHSGRKHTEEHIKKAAASRMGKSHTEQGKQNIRASKCKIVVCVQTQEVFLGTHHATEWCKKTNPKASQAAIARACKKPLKIAYGYNWRYQNENT